MPHPMPEDDPYDEDLDQNPNENSGDEKESENYGETFLAPKSAFAGKDLEVGAVHKVRVEATHDSEVELRCVKSDEREEAVMTEEPDELYE